MTRFSIEPPRTDLIVHHTFDDVELDRVVDHSPQRIDGKVVGDVTFGHTGVDGNAARLRNNESDIEISAIGDQMPQDEIHTSSWGKSEREVSATALNVFAQITIDGTQHSLGHSTTEPTTTWQYASLSYDGEIAELRYAHVDDERPIVVDEVETTGQVTDFELTFYTNGYGYVDDVRIYRSSLRESWDKRLFDIGAKSQFVDEMGDAWDNDGMPYIRGAGNARLAGAFGEEKAYVNRQLDAVLQARHINTAAGHQLDRIGEISSIGRREGETDAHYRARIIATLAAARSDGTFDDLLQITATILDTSVNRVEIQKQWESNPTSGIATAELFVRATDVDNVELTTSDLTDIMKNTVPAGHDIEVTEQGANPFTVRNDSQANDSSLGLTSDAISTGGGLVSDL